MRDGRSEDASGYIAQAASLALRSGERRLAAEAEAMLEDVEGSALHELTYVEALASMMLSVAALEDRTATAAGRRDEDLDALWEACASLGPLGNLESLGFQWARMYLRRRGWNTEETLRQEPVDE